jgi:hypothetical protein
LRNPRKNGAALIATRPEPLGSADETAEDLPALVDDPPKAVHPAQRVRPANSVAPLSVDHGYRPTSDSSAFFTKMPFEPRPTRGGYLPAIATLALALVGAGAVVAYVGRSAPTAIDARSARVARVASVLASREIHVTKPIATPLKEKPRK